jgi:hypothetical protein
MLTLGQRAALLLHCPDHPIAVCPRCAKAVSVGDVRSDAFMDHLEYCPHCNADLTAALRTHLAECTWIIAQTRQTRERAQTIRQDAREARQDAREAAKTSEQLQDRAEVFRPRPRRSDSGPGG